MAFSPDADQHGSRRKSRGVPAAIGAAIWIVALASGTAAAAAVPEPDYPPRTLVLLVAPWCAPCYGELARIESIVAAVRPIAVRVLIAEDDRRGGMMMRAVAPAYRWEPAGEDARRVRTGLLTRAAGLPYAAVADGDGRICAEINGVLDAARARALVQRCPVGESRAASP